MNCLMKLKNDKEINPNLTIKVISVIVNLILFDKPNNKSSVDNTLWQKTMKLKINFLSMLFSIL